MSQYVSRMPVGQLTVPEYYLAAPHEWSNEFTGDAEAFASGTAADAFIATAPSGYDYARSSNPPGGPKRPH